MRTRNTVFSVMQTGLCWSTQPSVLEERRSGDVQFFRLLTLREDWRLKNTSKIVKKLEQILPKAQKVVDLLRRHIAATLTAAPFIFAAGRTVVLPSERPELHCNSA